MGVEYQHYLVPGDPAFKPGVDQLCKLVRLLYGSGYLRTSGSCMPGKGMFGLFSPDYRAASQAGCLVHLGPDEYARFPCPCSPQDLAALGERDFRLIWAVDDLAASNLKYPLGRIPDEETYYDLELHAAGDFVYHTSSIIDPFDRPVTCPCGQLLEYDEDGPDRSIFSDRRIHRSCPRCGIPARPQDYTIRLRYGRTGDDLGPRPGGAAYLFAILIDCGKCYDREEPVEASEEFLRICQEAVGTPLFQIGDSSGC